MKPIIKRTLRQRRQRIEHRLRDRDWCPQDRPMFSAKSIQYDVSARDRAIGVGGIGAMQLLAQRLGIAEAIDSRLQLLKVHLPYHESDHVLNLAFNALAGGTCIEDLELLRNSEGYLDAIGAQHIPDPTTAGDFCRRFDAQAIDTLQDVFNDIRAYLSCRRSWSRRRARRESWRSRAVRLTLIGMVRRKSVSAVTRVVFESCGSWTASSSAVADA